jgi:hypothetical protein
LFYIKIEVVRVNNFSILYQRLPDPIFAIEIWWNIYRTDGHIIQIILALKNTMFCIHQKVKNLSKNLTLGSAGQLPFGGNPARLIISPINIVSLLAQSHNLASAILNGVVFH